MKTVWKFEAPVGAIGPGNYFDVEMPGGAELLTVQLQHNVPVMWAVCTEGLETRRRRFTWVPTGGKRERLHPDDYVGTVQFADGSFVLHLFEVLS